MAYSSDTNEKIVNFINRAQTRIGRSSTFIADRINKNARRESFQDVSDEAFLLDAFIRALDNTFNTWTEDEIVQCIEFWNARAKLNEVPYLSHEQYNFNIIVSNTTNIDFIPTANLNMLGFKITSLGPGTAAGDAVNKSQLDTKVAKAGDTMSGNLAMGGNSVTGLRAAVANGEAVRFEQIPTVLPPSGSAGGDLSGSYPNPTVLDDSHNHTPGTSIPAYPTTLPPSGAAGGALTGSYPNPELAQDRVRKSGDSMSGDLAMANNSVTGLRAATSNGEAVRFEQIPPAVLAGTNNFVLSSDSVQRYFKEIAIGDWNMDANDQPVAVTYAHGLDATKIRRVTATIFPDVGAAIPFYGDLAVGIFGGVGATISGNTAWTATLIIVNREVSGTFDSVDFDATGYNRGYITIEYVA